MPHVRYLPAFGSTSYISEKQGPTAPVGLREAERIIFEIHDGPAQTLASAFQYLQTVDQVTRPYFVQRPELDRLFSRAVKLVRQALHETREVINGSIPAEFEANGLVAAVRQEMERLEEETGCRTDLCLDAWPTINGEEGLAIYRIIHEALSNIRKHARSPRLEVEMRQKGGHLLVRVKDWGIGFTLDRQGFPQSIGSFGLLSMRRRTELLGGSFSINTAPGEGTEIIADIPWHR